MRQKYGLRSRGSFDDFRFVLVGTLGLSALCASAPGIAGVVGTGTAPSCTQAALQTQINAGGSVTFNCGGAATIALTSGIFIGLSNPAVVVDGAGQITLDGSTLASPQPMVSISGGSSALPSITFKGMTFSNGNATGTGLQAGGAILNGGNLTLDHDVFLHNQAPFGGAVVQERCSSAGQPPVPCVAASLVVTDSTFSNNSASNSGGAINLQSDTVSVSNSTFVGNSAGSGGAIYLFGNSTFTTSGTVVNSTFNGNSAGSNGGALAVTNLQGGSATLTSLTIAGNSATSSGGGVYATSPLTMQDTLLASNTGGNCNAGSFSGKNNLQFGDSSCSGVAVGNPQLAALANNGGPTQTMALGTGSAAIDAGDNTTCPATDQRGVARTDGDGNGSVVCDIGAYEAPTAVIAPPPPPLAVSAPALGPAAMTLLAGLIAAFGLLLRRKLD
jgi:predicted outer membrane repeat protein